MSYNSNAIKHLRGLDGIRKRPAMYIGNVQEGGLHCFKEILTNAVDETIASKTKQKEINIVLHKDNSISVRDYGRGIPFDKITINEEGTDVTATGAYLAYTKLHAGGKFDNSNYEASAGTFGAGAAVVTALSKHLVLISYRNNESYELHLDYVADKDKSEIEKTLNQLPKKIVAFENDSHLIVQQLWKSEKVKQTGTYVRFYLDYDKYFNGNVITLNELQSELSKQSLISDIKFILKNEATNETFEFYNTNGIKQKLINYNAELDPDMSVSEIFTLNYFDLETKINLDFAFEWTSDTEPTHFAYANNAIDLKDGGIQITSFVDNLKKWLNEHVETKIQFSLDDVRFGLKTVSNVTVPVELFEVANQTKTELSTPAVKQVMAKAFETFKLTKLQIKQIVSFLKNAIKVRSLIAESKVIKKSLNKTNTEILKEFADCKSKDKAECEIYLVEGQSAGGSLTRARDYMTQAVFPMKGKTLNSIKNTNARIFENKEIQTIFNALNCGIKKDYNEDNLRYDKIIITADADFDGYEVASLLLVLFYTYMPQLLKNGHIYLSNPPLYVANLKNSKENYFFYNETDLNKWKKEHKNKFDPNSIVRYKGHGQMNEKEVKQTLMNKESRVLTQLKVKDWNELHQLVELFFKGDKKSIEARKDYIKATNRPEIFNRQPLSEEFKN